LEIDMRTTLNIRSDVIEEVIKITGAKNKSRAVTQALEQFVRERQVQKLLSLKGKLHLEETWKKLREMELDER
jgi:Arc/MetJ family transcription regulator